MEQAIDVVRSRKCKLGSGFLQESECERRVLLRFRMCKMLIGAMIQVPWCSDRLTASSQILQIGSALGGLLSKLRLHGLHGKF